MVQKHNVVPTYYKHCTVSSPPKRLACTISGEGEGWFMVFRKAHNKINFFAKCSTNICWICTTAQYHCELLALHYYVCSTSTSFVTWYILILLTA